MKRPSIDDLLARFQSLQQELEQEMDQLLAERRRQFHYSLKKGRVRFERGIRRLQRQQRVGLWSYLRHARLSHMLSAPIIYAVALPMVLLDLGVTLYQQICFRIYGIPLVRRRDYFLIDRHKLAYLNLIERFNCYYCAYGNGLMEYAREITARTEKYWCPIKHARRSPDPHRYQSEFVDFGDAEAYRKRFQTIRNDWRTLRQTPSPSPDE